MSRLFKISSILLIVLLFTVGSLPAAGEQFPGISHWIAHLIVYALIAFTFGMGWGRIPATFVALMIGAIGVLHELTEIVFHAHPFETHDAVVNICGALAGSAVLALYRNRAR
jgi:hypothetical protein